MEKLAAQREETRKAFNENPGMGLLLELIQLNEDLKMYDFTLSLDSK